MAGWSYFTFCVMSFHPKNTICIVIHILVFFVQMAKTHLEHQPVKYRLRPNQNGSTTCDPYSNYNPQQGLTTATILGTGFLLVILYIVLKVTWPKAQKRCCGDRFTHRAVLDMETQIMREQPDQITSANNIAKQRVPIAVKMDGGWVNGDEEIESQIKLSSLRPDQLPFQSNSPDCVITPEAFTMVISEKNTQSATPKTRHQPLKRNVLPDSSDTAANLPPLVDQVLRTAHWVSSVNDQSLGGSEEELTLMEDVSRNHNQSTLDDTGQGVDPLVIQAEINHRKHEHTKSNRSLDNNIELINTTQV